MQRPVLHPTDVILTKSEDSVTKNREWDQSYPLKGSTLCPPGGERRTTQLGQLAQGQGQVEGEVSLDGNKADLTEATKGTVGFRGR